MQSRVQFLLIGLLAARATVAEATDLAPDWSLASAEGPVVRLSEQVQEQPVILVFWATWCPYCKALMPHLQSIRLEYGDRVKIIAVNFRENDDPVAFLQNAGYDFTVLPEGDAVAELYGIYGTPGVVIVDRNRRVRFDLRAVPRRNLPESQQSASHSRKAAYLAPYWAAEIRKSVDLVLAEASP